MTARMVRLDGVIIETTEYIRLDDGDDLPECWLELGYEGGTIDFTILQINFIGDYKPDKEKLERILAYARKEICGQ